MSKLNTRHIIDFGKIIKISRTEAIVSNYRQGPLVCPLEAVQLSIPDADDLKTLYKRGETLMYTAERIDGQYMIQSACRPSDMLSEKVMITNIDHLKCKMEGYSENIGKVFIPFNTNVAGTEPEGTCMDVNVGSYIHVRVMRQLEILGYHFIAFSKKITPITEEEVERELMYIESNSMPKTNPEPNTFVKGQVGIIVRYDPVIDKLIINSALSGDCIYTGEMEEWTKLGVVVTYDKNDGQCDKITFVRDLKPTYHMKHPGKVFIRVNAVVLRANLQQQSYQLWSDSIGRISVPVRIRSRLNTHDVVEVIATYECGRKEMQWEAVRINSIWKNHDQVRKECCRFLATGDNWIVKDMHGGGPQKYGFIAHPKVGSTFYTGKDLNGTTDILPVDTLVRCTFVREYRENKHEFSPLLITPLDKNGEPISHHPYNFSSR